MTLFHWHKWEEVTRRFQPSDVTEINLGEVQVRGVGSAAALDSLKRDLKKFVLGVTFIEFRCTKCGVVVFIEEIGDQRK